MTFLVLQKEMLSIVRVNGVYLKLMLCSVVNPFVLESKYKL